MKILLDHCVPRPFRHTLSGHDIITARDMGWETLKNGVLLDAAQDAAFDVLLTVDQNLRYQQNLQDRELAVIVMIANGITMDDLRPLVPVVASTLLLVQPGRLYEVTSEHRQT
jgi:hypothetical protein